MNTHVIVTYTGVHYFVTAEQEVSLRSKALDEELVVEGCILKVKNIADILTTAKYYETHPRKKPVNADRFKTLEGMGFAGMIKNSRETAIKGIINGLKQYLNSTEENPIKNRDGEIRYYRGTDAQKELLKLAEASLNN